MQHPTGSMIEVTPHHVTDPSRATITLRRGGGRAHLRWRSWAVQWGVVRRPGCFDMHDGGQHAGLTQHAFPLGRDWMAVCGFRTPLKRAFDGILRPLLAMADSSNPKCGVCARAVVPDARPPSGLEPPIASGPFAWEAIPRWLTVRMGVIEPTPRAAAPVGGESRPAFRVLKSAPWPEADLQARTVARLGRPSQGGYRPTASE